MWGLYLVGAVLWLAAWWAVLLGVDMVAQWCHTARRSDGDRPDEEGER